MTAHGPKDQAIRMLCAQHLHQCLWLPQIADHPRLRVTYSTTSNFDDTSLPAILFIPPMFGGRWMTIELDKLARDCGVRMICPDRPSMGGSTPVHLSIRMRVWLETVPALLQELNVEHVSLLTHSAGTMYTLNTLAELRSILDPKAPYVAFLAPWVTTTQSDATLMSLVSKLPASVMDSWSGLQGFIRANVAPAVSASGGLISSTAALIGPKATGDTQPPAGSAEEAAEHYGVDVDTAKVITSLSTKYNLAEDTTAGNEEAKLCMLKGGPANWGVAADYETCIRSIAEKERSLAGSEKLKVDACFAGSDIMISKGGQAYFEKCWRQEGIAECVDFESRTCEGTNHDSVLVDFRRGGLKACLETVASRHRT